LELRRLGPTIRLTKAFKNCTPLFGHMCLDVFAGMKALFITPLLCVPSTFENFFFFSPKTFACVLFLFLDVLWAFPQAQAIAMRTLFFPPNPFPPVPLPKLSCRPPKWPIRLTLPLRISMVSLKAVELYHRTVREWSRGKEFVPPFLSASPSRKLRHLHDDQEPSMFLGESAPNISWFFPEKNPSGRPSPPHADFSPLGIKSILLSGSYMWSRINISTGM